MSGFLRRLAMRASGVAEPGALRPRLPSLFEPMAPDPDATWTPSTSDGSAAAGPDAAPAGPRLVETEAVRSGVGGFGRVRVDLAPAVAPRRAAAGPGHMLPDGTILEQLVPVEDGLGQARPSGEPVAGEEAPHRGLDVPRAWPAAARPPRSEPAIVGGAGPDLPGSDPAATPSSPVPRTLVAVESGTGPAPADRRPPPFTAPLPVDGTRGAEPTVPPRTAWPAAATPPDAVRASPPRGTRPASAPARVAGAAQPRGSRPDLPREARQAAPATGERKEQVVSVTIGRIEVRATPPAGPPAPQAAPEPAISLAEYLAGRERR